MNAIPPAPPFPPPPPPRAVSQLLRTRQRMSHELNEELVNAAWGGDVPTIERLVAAGADVNANVGHHDWTPLQRGVYGGHAAAVTALLSAGAHVDGATRDGSTPIVIAGYYGRTALVHLLVAAGADVRHADGCGSTALHLAVRNSHSDCIRALLDAGADVAAVDKGGKAAVHEVSSSRADVTSWRTHNSPPPLPPPRSRQINPNPWGHPSHLADIAAVLARYFPWARRRPAAGASYDDLWWDSE
jgi:hypothetical protein